MFEAVQQTKHRMTSTTIDCSSSLLQASSNVQLRFLNPEDIDVIRVLCNEWFPIRYPECWYQDLAGNQRFYTLVATIANDIVGLIVADMREASQSNSEDSGILCPEQEHNSRLVYILTLGVVSQYRRRGIASLLIDRLIENVKTNPTLEDCRAIYLHVLTTNTSALGFYSKLNFICHKMLGDYYLINNSSCDGYLYVLYVNGGRPPKTLLSYCIDLFTLVGRTIATLVSPLSTFIYRRLSPTRHKGNVYTL